MPHVKVTTSDKAVVELPPDQVKMFGMINTMLDALGAESSGEEGDSIPIDVNKVEAEILQLILRWTEYHANDPESSDDEDEDEPDRRVDDIPQWDMDFIKQQIRADGSPHGDFSKLFQLMQAANYLEIPLLLTFCCKYVASVMRNLSVEEARAQFHVKNDYAAHEEAALKEENKWAEEPAES
jgi:S-phase kinase-associated protein 1